MHFAGFNSHADPPKPITVSSTSTNNQTEPLPLNPSKNSTLQQIVIQKLRTGMNYVQKVQRTVGSDGTTCYNRWQWDIIFIFLILLL